MGAEVIGLLARFDQGFTQPLQQAEAGSIDTGDGLIAAICISVVVGGSAYMMHRIGWLGENSSSQEFVDETPQNSQEE
jgi:hypothetical protein